VQALRADSQGILVGVGTVLSDDPSLRVHWELLDGRSGPSPMRIILDSNGRTPATAQVLDGRQPTAVATSVGCARTFPSHVQHLRFGERSVDLIALLGHLEGAGVRSLLVEGGGHVFSSFLSQGLFDEFTIYVAPVIIGGPTAPSVVAEGESADPLPLRRLRLRASRRVDDGILLEYVPA
jgi:2,5-diamino-6-(ribosylamino)-4(3H)-pyrimidinone 5'-phosphate reductase